MEPEVPIDLGCCVGAVKVARHHAVGMTGADQDFSALSARHRLVQFVDDAYFECFAVYQPTGSRRRRSPAPCKSHHACFSGSIGLSNVAAKPLHETCRFATGPVVEQASL